jgi:hypothetical protein
VVVLARIASGVDAKLIGDQRAVAITTGVGETVGEEMWCVVDSGTVRLVPVELV